MNGSNDLLRVLERSPWFKGIPVSVLHAISMFGEHRALRPGEVLVRQGQPATTVWLVASGEVMAEGEGDVFGPGALLGHLDLVCGAPSSATWVARVAAAVMAFSAGDFAKLAEDRGLPGSAFRRALIISLADQLRDANQALAAYITANPSAARPSRGFLDELSGVLSGTRAPRVRKR